MRANTVGVFHLCGVPASAAHELAGGQAAVIDLDPQGSATVWGRPANLARLIAEADDVSDLLGYLVVLKRAKRAREPAAGRWRWRCGWIAEEVGPEKFRRAR